MTDKQIIIDELKNEIACKENIINHLAEHNIKLQVQFKEKEQECEYWKHQAELGLDTTDSLVKELEEKEQECERLKDKLNCRFCYPIMKIDDPENFKLCQETDCFRRQLDKLKAKLSKLKSRILCENEDDLLYELMQIIEE